MKRGPINDARFCIREKRERAKEVDEKKSGDKNMKSSLKASSARSNFGEDFLSPVAASILFLPLSLSLSLSAI